MCKIKLKQNSPNYTGAAGNNQGASGEVKRNSNGQAPSLEEVFHTGSFVYADTSYNASKDGANIGWGAIGNTILIPKGRHHQAVKK